MFSLLNTHFIKDANTLLEKTWESLKKSCEPLISISGTVTELYRLGYKGQPVRLHDMAIVEIEETGEQFYKLIVCNDVDLVNPDGTRPEIGDYIPNIVYINRDTDKKATGGGGGGRGSGSMTNLEDDDVKTFTEFVKTNNLIGLVAGIKNGNMYIKGGEITLAINEDGGTTAKLQADTIDIEGIVDELTAYDLTTQTLHALNTLTIEGEATFANGVTCIDGSGLDAGYADVGSLTVDNIGADWQSKQISTPTYGTRRYFLYAASSGSTTPTGTTQHYPITGHTEATIHYLGSADT